MKKKFLIILLILLIISASTVGFYLLKKNMTSKGNDKKIELYTIPASEKVYVNGVITPSESEDIFLDPTKGTVNEVAVENNQAVTKDELLFTYKNDAVSDQIYELNSQISSTKKQIEQLEKEKSNLKTQLGGTAPLDGVTSQLEPLKAQLSSLQDQVSHLKNKEYTNVNSPIDGNVILHDSKEATSPYMTIETTDLYVKGNISEKELPKLKEKQTANILVLPTNQSLKGKVSSVGNRPLSSQAVSLNGAGAAGGSSDISHYGVNISLDSQTGLTNGFHVQATINLTDPTIKIPKTAVLGQKDNYYVFKSVNNKTVKQKIKYSKESEGNVIVTEGLKENDVIIKKPSPEMKEGIVVE
ncbi:efflux RND transporter periplasmic adaptor subunit [Clostridium senegalense]